MLDVRILNLLWQNSTLVLLKIELGVFSYSLLMEFGNVSMKKPIADRQFILTLGRL